jgi:D-aminopeptidase
MIPRRLIMAVLAIFAIAARPVRCEERPLKVLVIYDMEGVSGATVYEHTNFYHAAQYAVGRRSLTADVNAAISGLRSAGATTIVVVDGHGSENDNGPDVLEDDLLPPAKVLYRDLHFDEYVDSYDQSFDAIVAIGMHAGAGNSAGFLSHTCRLKMLGTKSMVPHSMNL